MVLALATLSALAACVVPAAQAAALPVGRALARLAVVACALLPFVPAEARAENAAALLKAVDARREVPDGGFVTDVTFTSQKGGAAPVRFRVAGKDGATLAYAVSDKPGERLAILSRGAGMWMQKESMRRPLRISPAERLVGAAANADVLTVQYGADYEAVEVKSTGRGKSRRYMLVLVPKSDSQTAAYGKIRIVTAADGTVSAGEFFAVSGRLLKRATFVYTGARRRLKAAVITDAVDPDEVTRVDYGAMTARSFSDAFFNPQSLTQSAARL